MNVEAHPGNTYIAGRLAQKHAVDLVAYAGFEWPRSFVEGDNPVSERLHESGLAFAVNARRYIEHTGQRPEVSEMRYRSLKSADASVETRLYEALNGLIHSRRMKILYAPLQKSQYDGVEGVAPIYFVYETDRYPEKKVSILGLGWSFLKLEKTSLEL